MRCVLLELVEQSLLLALILVSILNLAFGSTLSECTPEHTAELIKPTAGSESWGELERQTGLQAVGCSLSPCGWHCWSV